MERETQKIIKSRVKLSKDRAVHCSSLCIYLDWLLLLEDRREVRQDEPDVLVLGALFCNQQHIGQHKGNHVWVYELGGQCWQDPMHHYSL